MNQTLNRTINDWTSSDEKAAMSLLFTLEELKSELMSGLTQYKSMDHIGPLPKAEKAVWRQEKMASQGMRHSKSGMVKAAFKSETSQGGSTSPYRMEKSYLHFLPAESSLKALIYQNRYLQLLIQGFHVVAHLGVFPSNKTHKWALTSCPFHQFRMEVGVVISILCFILFIYLFLSR
uniref:Pericentrin-like isoform X1 n=1 Tax=Phascolarctos cinereus TaxID=38626 RepID=A0A6P5JPA0_PHACI|nr:pericentrin-like isoform X1 [Phascolarctos cinereus]XP_020836000.1 pericentrin-like isoform X1 [Phascolarctos cinereus]